MPRVATISPASFEHEATPGVSVSFDDEPTTEIDLLEVDAGTRAGLAAERKARHRLVAALENQAKQIGKQQDTIAAMGHAIDALALSSADAKTAAAGAAMAKQVRRLLVAVALLVPGAGLGAGRAFLDARDAAAATAQRSASEAAALRHDIDSLRSEVAELTRLLWSHSQ